MSVFQWQVIYSTIPSIPNSTFKNNHTFVPGSIISMVGVPTGYFNITAFEQLFPKYNLKNAA